MQKHDHYGHRERLRTRVRTEGLENFFDHQVLEYALTFVIPYKDTNPIAHRLINKFGNLAGVLEASVEELKEIDGMGEVSAQFLTSFIKIFAIYEKQKVIKSSVLKNPAETYNFCKSLFKGKLVEEIYMACLSPTNKVLSVQKVAEGTTSEVKITIRQITDIISKNGASNIIIAHNHPKGNSEPSDADDKFTKALVTTLVINGVALLDHIIIGEEDFYTYCGSGALDKLKEEAGKMFATKFIAQKHAKYGVDYD